MATAIHTVQSFYNLLPRPHRPAPWNDLLQIRPPEGFTIADVLSTTRRCGSRKEILARFKQGRLCGAARVNERIAAYG